MNYADFVLTPILESWGKATVFLEINANVNLSEISRLISGENL